METASECFGNGEANKKKIYIVSSIHFLVILFPKNNTCIIFREIGIRNYLSVLLKDYRRVYMQLIYCYFVSAVNTYISIHQSLTINSIAIFKEIIFSTRGMELRNGNVSKFRVLIQYFQIITFTCA